MERTLIKIGSNWFAPVFTYTVWGLDLSDGNIRR